MTVLVTGVAGFIGSHLTDALIARGDDVVGVDAFTPFYADKRVNLRGALATGKLTLIQGDLCTLAAPVLAGMLDGVAEVYHLAGQPGVRTSWGDGFADYAAHNVLATQRLLEACVSARALTAVVYASSSSIYGRATGRASELSALVPASPYGVTKLAGEHLAFTYARECGVPAVAVRYFTVYGPRQRPDMAIRRFIEAVLAGTPLIVHGSGDQQRDFTFVGDAVRGTLAAATYGVSGEAYNLAGGTRASVREVIAWIEWACGQSADVVHTLPLAGDVDQTWGDTARAARALHWAPLVTLAEGIAAEVAWCRDRVAVHA